jgi:hypothetical protein
MRLAASRKRKAEELENARRAEEEMMEARRRELLSEENGYWRKRMAQEKQRALAEEASTDAKPTTVRFSARLAECHPMHVAATFTGVIIYLRERGSPSADFCHDRYSTYLVSTGHI